MTRQTTSRRVTIGEQLYQPEGSPDDFQADLERDERRRRFGVLEITATCNQTGVKIPVTHIRHIRDVTLILASLYGITEQHAAESLLRGPGLSTDGFTYTAKGYDR